MPQKIVFYSNIDKAHKEDFKDSNSDCENY